MEFTDKLDVSTTRGSVDSFLQLEDRPFDFSPGDCLPFIPWEAHDFCTVTGNSTVQIAVTPFAYPLAFLMAFASV